MKTVIMAGGKGTRIREINAEVPKPMVEILGKPILQYEIECLVQQGFSDITLVVGYLGQQIKDYFGDGGKFGAQIDYIVENEPLGTAGALFYLKEQVTEDFLLLNGDIMFNMDLNRLVIAHKKNNCLATIVTHPNNHPYDSGIIEADEAGKVMRWLHKEDERTWYKNRVNAGIHVLSEEILNRFTEAKKTDLDRDVLKALIPEKQLFVYDTPEYIKDMGTPERYYEVINDINSGKYLRKSLKNKQRAIFLDRDGTLNKYVGFLRDSEQLELLEGSAEAVRRINDSDYLAIVVTNQPVIARGEVTVEELELIHKKLETLLGEKGAFIDDLFYCPHHPDKGFEGEIVELKIECDCRKPKPGLLLKAAEKYNIDLSQSFMIGDGDNDIQAGMAAGCKNTLKITDEKNLLDLVKDLL